MCRLGVAVSSVFLCACSTAPATPNLRDVMRSCPAGSFITFTAIDGSTAFAGPALDWSAGTAVSYRGSPVRAVSRRELETLIDKLDAIDDPMKRATICGGSDMPRLMLVMTCGTTSWSTGWRNDAPPPSTCHTLSGMNRARCHYDEWRTPTTDDFNEGLTAFDLELQRLATP